MRTSRSSSTSSTTSSTEDTHHIFVKLLSGETIPLTIPTSTPIPHLQHLLSLRTSAPASSIRLTYAGRHLTNPSSATTTIKTTTPPPLPPQSPPTTTTTTTTTSSTAEQPTTLSTLPQNALLHLSLPLLGGNPPNSTATSTSTSTTTRTPNPKRKQKCTFKDCKSPAQRIVGDCSFCQGHFCGNHRMLEDHKCTGLEDCKAEAHERNREVLEGGKTVVVRGI